MSLSNIARSKLTLSSSSNLHRWVLLKNSILASGPTHDSPTPPNSPTSSKSPPLPEPDPHAAAFLFPTYYSYPDEAQDIHSRSSEALWLDTLLESLAHDEEDEPEHDHPPIEDEEDEDEDDEPEILSPMSSSDDLSIPYYPPRTQSPTLPPLPLALPFPFSDLDVLDDNSLEDDDDSDPLKCSSCSCSTSSTSPSSSASSLPPSTPPSSPLRSWASVPKLPLAPLPSSTTPSISTPYIDAYSDPLPFSRTFTYDFQSPFVFHHHHC